MARPPPFEEVYRSTRDRVLALCLQVTGRRADAEDAVQETFLAVHRSLALFRGDSAAATWVYRIAVREALRVRARRRPALECVTAEAADEAGGTLDGEARLEARDGARRVAEALARLAPTHRVVLALFAVEGLTHREIAEVLGVPEGTIWSRLHTARKHLAQAMGSRSPT